MKILIIGDIYGVAGVFKVQTVLPQIKLNLKPDIVIANAENSSFNGKSLSVEDYDRLRYAGVDYFTMGNHTYRNPEFENKLASKENIVVPANAFTDKPGNRSIIINWHWKRILLFQLEGQAFMNDDSTNPFKMADKILDNNEYDLAILDFHAEATSEKLVLANYLKDRVGIFFGTHTHVTTADERMMKEMAYITDVGMTGVFDSAIGANFKEVEDRFRGKRGEKFKEAQGDTSFNSILVELYDNTLKPFKIERIQVKY